MAIKAINQIQPRSIDVSCPFSATTMLGLSTDVKPINVGAGSIFEETNTGNVYKFDGTNWFPTSQGSNNIAPDGTAYDVTLGLFDFENYNGKVFTFSRTSLAVASNAYFDVHIKAGTKPVYFEIFYTAELKARFSTYLNTTYSNNGTLVTPFPRNTGSTYTPLTTTYTAPTITTLGSLRGSDFVGNNTSPQTRAGGGGAGSGSILKANDDLLLRLQNVGGSASDLNLIINMLEF